MKFGNFYVSLIFILLNVQFGNSQVLTTNEKGDKIVVYPDGSFRYAEDADIKNMTQKGSIADVEQGETDKDLEIAIRIAELAAAEESDAIRKAEDAQYNRLLIEDELKEAEESGEYFEDEIRAIKDRLKKAKKAEKKARSTQKQATKKAKKAEKLMTMSREERAKALQKYDLYHTLMKEEVSSIASTDEVGMFPGEMPETEVEEIEESKFENKQSTNSRIKPSLVKYDVSKDVYYNPAGSKCQLTFNGIDEFSGKKRKDVEKQLLFNYTNEELRQVYKDKDYMTCTAYLSSLSGGLKFLTLNITIASKTAQREYGILEKGGTINVKLLNGDNVKMVNTKTNMGIENSLDGSTTYRAQYLVSSGDEKKLKKSEIDKLRIVWSSGYEDYEIYEMDFFINQFKCLDSK